MIIDKKSRVPDVSGVHEQIGARGETRERICQQDITLRGELMDRSSRLPLSDDIEALRRRDRQAWEALYDAQWVPLCAFIRAQLGDALVCTVQPEEVAQEVFCRAYSEITRFRGEARLETWLRSIALHAVMAGVREPHTERRP